MSKPVNDIWKDENVKAALKDGRSADDIAILDCPKCGRYGYYNQGSGFYCRFCRVSFMVLSEDERAPRGVPSVRSDEAVTLADTLTVTTNGYDNMTL